MEMRRCAGSAKFGIEAHEAPVEDFPKQASQKDGLGRMCRVHWNEYTTALRKAALERRAGEGEGSGEEPRPESATEVPATEPEATPTKGSRGRRRGAKDAEVAQEGAAS